MGWLRRLFRRHDGLIPVNEVFTPGSPAKRLFVERTREEKRLKSALSSAGMQVILFGESGAGKSSLAEKVLGELKRRYVVTRCTSKTTFEQLMDSGFDELASFTTVEKRTSTDVELGGSTTLGGGKLPASLGAKASYRAGEGETARRVVDPQTSPAALAKRFKSRDCSWLIEDFHKVPQEVRDGFADVLKIFSDTAHPRTAIIVLGARETSDDVVNLPSANVTNRVAPIELRPLTDTELGELLDEGGRLLNVDFSEVRADIIASSAGVASVTHGLAKACLDQLDIEVKQKTLFKVSASVWDDAATEYVETYAGGVRAQFTKALTDKGTKQSTYKNYKVVVRALASFPEHGATRGELLTKIREVHPDYPGGNLDLYLRKLGEEPRGEIVRKTAEGKFRFDRPLQLTYARTWFKLGETSGLFAEKLEQYVPAERDTEVEGLDALIEEYEKEHAKDHAEYFAWLAENGDEYPAPRTSRD
ncbi:ATP-binding protein [Agromyces mariniharenae]|uniref:ATP-binding protein n=1 Tax=Agromyces mariniharenae TaxID=2604423 RepID=A0A5S4V5P2_9MICO|nr:AAA family ATPase [Agromyces mariniharenae]TYL53163.1 ATP-binding protein [Agromyces mariniharenae]